MSVIRSMLALVITLFAIGSANGAEPTLPASGALQKCVAAVAAKSDFSGIILIARPDGTISHVQGLMSGPDSSAISSSTQFNLGSAGKMFTAVAVAQLADAKKIDLDDPVGHYVSGLTAEAGAVTIRQLLTHSSGLGNFFTPDNLAQLQKARSLSDLKPLVTDEKPAFLPGSQFQYSNTGFLLLGLMIERVSDQSYGDYLKQHIFVPAGMGASGLLPGGPSKRAVGMTNMPNMEAPVGVMTGPSASPDRRRQRPPSDAPDGLFRPPPGPLRPAVEAALTGNSAGGGYSSAPDLQRFFSALLAGKLTSNAMRDLLLSPQIVAIPAKDGRPARSYGLGFGVGAYSGHRWTGHNGGTLGVNVETMTFPDDQTTMIIMANRDPPNATALMRQILSLLFDKAACERLSDNEDRSGSPVKTCL